MDRSQVMKTSLGAGWAWQRLGLRMTGAGLVIATGAIPLDLYVTGYRTIPTIGWLFLLQVIAAFVLGAAVLVLGDRLAAAAGAGFALSPLGGYLLSIWVGLFGFKEIRTTAGIVAGVIEVAAVAVLAALAATPAPAASPAPAARHQPARQQPARQQPAGSESQRAGQMTRLMAGLRDGDLPGAGKGVVGLSVVALVLIVVAVAGAGGSPSSSSSSAAGPGPALKTTKICGVSMCTSATRLTLYSFV